MSLTENSNSEDRHEAFVAHFARDQRRVHAYIGTLVPNTADAEEVMQETSIILWRKFSQFRADADFVRWACGIARLEVLKYYREQRRQGGIVLSDELIEAISAEQQRQRHEHDARREALRACLEELDDDQRRVLAHRYGQSVTTRELAAQLGRPASTLYKSIDRTRDQLRECVRRRLAAEEYRS